MTLSILPEFVLGDHEFGVTDLSVIYTAGYGEFNSNDPRSNIIYVLPFIEFSIVQVWSFLLRLTSFNIRFKRKTFALRIGYDGTKYNGYQIQKGVVGTKTTVEEDIEASLGRKVVAAGRTDKDVSAVSQIVSFTTFDDIDNGNIIGYISL